jgi:hypothetical protein
MREVLVADVVITNEDVNQLEVVGDLIRHIETVDDYKRRPPPRPDELKEDGPASLGAIRSPAGERRHHGNAAVEQGVHPTNAAACRVVWCINRDDPNTAEAYEQEEATQGQVLGCPWVSCQAGFPSCQFIQIRKLAVSFPLDLPPPTLNNSGMPFGLPDSGAG